MWPLGHVGHVTYSFINMLFISTGIFYDKLCPQILSVGTTANAALNDRHIVAFGYLPWETKVLTADFLFFLQSVGIEITDEGIV